VNDSCFIFSLNDLNKDDFEDTKSVMRSHKSKKNRKYSRKKKKTNNNQQKTPIILNSEQHESY
jgi:hypothetical protein